MKNGALRLFYRVQLVTVKRLIISYAEKLFCFLYASKRFTQTFLEFDVLSWLFNIGLKRVLRVIFICSNHDVEYNTLTLNMRVKICYSQEQKRIPNSLLTFCLVHVFRTARQTQLNANKLVMRHLMGLLKKFHSSWVYLRDTFFFYNVIRICFHGY